MNESEKERLIKGIEKNKNLTPENKDERKKYRSGTFNRKSPFISFVKQKPESKFSNNSIQKINLINNDDK